MIEPDIQKSVGGNGSDIAVEVDKGVYNAFMLVFGQRKFSSLKIFQKILLWIIFLSCVTLQTMALYALLKKVEYGSGNTYKIVMNINAISFSANNTNTTSSDGSLNATGDIDQLQTDSSTIWVRFVACFVIASYLIQYIFDPLKITFLFTFGFDLYYFLHFAVLQTRLYLTLFAWYVSYKSIVGAVDSVDIITQAPITIFIIELECWLFKPLEYCIPELSSLFEFHINVNTKRYYTYGAVIFVPLVAYMILYAQI